MQTVAPRRGVNPTPDKKARTCIGRKRDETPKTYAQTATAAQLQYVCVDFASLLPHSRLSLSVRWFLWVHSTAERAVRQRVPWHRRYGRGGSFPHTLTRAAVVCMVWG